MKKLMLILIFALISIGIQAQEKTLVGDGHTSHGGFGAPVVKFTSINGDFAILVGGRGGWIINHTFVIGGGGYGLVSDIDPDFTTLIGRPGKLNFGYGGFEMEYINNSHEVVHFTLYSLLGAGSVSLRDKDFDFTVDFESDEFFVGELAGNIEVNITSFFRLNAGLGYRFVSGVDYADLEDSVLGGVYGQLTFKFGSF